MTSTMLFHWISTSSTSSRRGSVWAVSFPADFNTPLASWSRRSVFWSRRVATEGWTVRWNWRSSLASELTDRVTVTSADCTASRNGLSSCDESMVMAVLG